MEKLDKRVNNNEELLLTRDGLAKLEKELNNLRTVKRKEIAARIKEAISYGDITDNSEYEDAKNEQAFIEGRIITLEKMLRRARLLEKEENGDQRIVLGSTVQLKDLDVNELYEYTIVSTAEADPVEKKISNESPVGKALLGLTVGDQVEIKVPVGTLKYKIEAVN
ncbi:MAG: transcription elongation factor GreA [Firmicutes bacterium ML8_F2]|nr:MAG: transcription elongation factor GreA [Firmicutes bacterium ML8_F2]